MADKAWKAFERRVAAVFGGRRRGADTRGADGGKTDVVHDHYAIECKLLARPTYSDMRGAVAQAERNASPGQEPIAIVKRKNFADDDALVIMRLATFREWRL